MKYDLIVISGNTLDSGPSVGFFFPGSTHLFNVPDKTQWIYGEHSFRISRIRHIFLTYMRARALGGYHGLLIAAFESTKQAT
jgi:hypothetical protein